jgi:hypothetical protein
MKFTITIEEHITQKFEIEADDMESAMNIAEEKYKNDELVVENAELQTALIQGYCPETDEATEFTEIY